MAKDIKKEIDEIEETVDEMQEIVNDAEVTEEETVKTKSKIGAYVKAHWKGWVRNALIFTAGAAFKTGLDYVLGGNASVDTVDTTSKVADVIDISTKEAV